MNIDRLSEVVGGMEEHLNTIEDCVVTTHVLDLREYNIARNELRERINELHNEIQAER
jgi:hypothetical protein